MSDKSINLGVNSDKQSAAGFPAATRANVPGLRSEMTAAQDHEGCACEFNLIHWNGFFAKRCGTAMKASWDCTIPT